jgi:hypothetical protein
MSAQIITLTTDFGTRDTYVAQMKGVLLSINPRAVIVDITHAVPAQDVRHGAIVLHEAFGAFPSGTVHVAVVDPGVGGQRRLLAVEAAEHKFLAPDNGLLTCILKQHPTARIVQLARQEWWREDVSRTFHGRDILAPVAAHWSLGADAEMFGPAVDPQGLCLLDMPAPRTAAGRLYGAIEQIDRFGNLITNVRLADLPACEPAELVIMAGKVRVRGLSRYYAEQPMGSLVALIGSSGKLELAINGGNAAQTLNLAVGNAIQVSCNQDGAL